LNTIAILPAHADKIAALLAGPATPRAIGRDGARRFDDALATCAGELGSHMANDLEVSRDELQYLGYVFSKVAQRAAAIGAAIVLWMVGWRCWLWRDRRRQLDASSAHMHWQHQGCGRPSFYQLTAAIISPPL